jgi:hypothetical protein
MATDVRSTMVYGPLRDQSIQYKNASFIGTEIFPQITVSPKAKILLYDRGPWFRAEAAPRIGGTAAVRGNFTYTTQNINTTNWAIATEITDEDRRDAQFMNSVPLQPEMDAVDYATNGILLRKETVVGAHVVGATSAWSGQVGGQDVAGTWAAGAGNTFIADVITGINDIKAATGIKPNRLLLSANTMFELMQEATLLNRIQYSSLGVITEQLIAQLFGLDKVIVSDQIVNTADEGIVDELTARYIFEQNTGHGSAFLYYYGPAGLKQINSGYICTLPNDGGIRSIYRWRDDARHCDVIEAAEEFDVLDCAPYTARLFRDTILT